MSFINPFLLIGILAAGIPLLIHLWSRRRARLVDFSHVRFLMSLHRKKIRRLRLKQILILILRMLIVILIALALARPILTSKWAMAAGSRARSSVVIVLDNSYSMSYERLDGHRFNMAKDWAFRILDSLQPGDNASLILMSDVPDVVFKRLTPDIGQVRDAIVNARISHRGSRVWPSISEARGLLKESDNPRKVIYLISDLGENGWQDWKDTPGDQDVADIFVLRIGEKEAGNRTIRNVALSSEPAGIGIPLRISIELEGLSGTEPDEQAIELFVDGEKKGQTVADIALGDPRTVSFTHTFQHPGTHIGEVRLTPDRLPLDDVRYFAVNVLGQIRVLSAGDSNLFVNLALNPVTSLNPEEQFLILPVGCTAEELGTFSLDQYSVVILTDVTELPEDTVRNLMNFVIRGGNLVIFLGEAADGNWHNSHFDSMPLTLGKRMWFQQSPLRLVSWDMDHPIFKVFHDEGPADEFANSLEFYSALSIEPRTDTQALEKLDENNSDSASANTKKSNTKEVIARFNNDIPAILEIKDGKGRAILFNTSLDTKVSNLPLDPAFLPLMQQTVFYLASRPRSGDRNILVGDTYAQSVWEVVDPSASITDPENNVATPLLEALEEDRYIQYGPVERSGIYKLDFKSEGSLRSDYFAVNLNTTGESHLRAIEDSEVLGKLGERARFISLDDASAEVVFAPTFNQSGSEFSSRLLIVALILMLVEIPLANRRRAMND